MSSKYVGTWKLESSENFDQYMQAVGQWSGFCRAHVLPTFVGYRAIFDIPLIKGKIHIRYT